MLDENAQNLTVFFTSVAEVFRKIPMPDDKIYQNLSKQDRNDLMANFQKLSQNLSSKIEIIKKFNMSCAGNINAFETNFFLRIILGSYANIITKMRIVSYEIFIKGLPEQCQKSCADYTLDATWFKSFLASSYNFTASKEQYDEQMGLLAYFEKNKSKTPVLMGLICDPYIRHNIRGEELQEHEKKELYKQWMDKYGRISTNTNLFFDNLLTAYNNCGTNTVQEATKNIQEATENMHKAKIYLSGIWNIAQDQNHYLEIPKCKTQEYVESTKKIVGDGNYDLICNFQQIMFYGINHQDAFFDRCQSHKLTRYPPQVANQFEHVGGGFVGKTENEGNLLNNQKLEYTNVGYSSCAPKDSFVHEVFENKISTKICFPQTQTSELINLAIENLDIFRYYMQRNGPDSDPRKLAVFEHALLRHTRPESVTGQQASAEDVENSSEYYCILAKDAKNDPNRIRSLADKLLAAGREKFWDKQIGKTPVISAMAGIMHIQHEMYDQIIQQQEQQDVECNKNLKQSIEQSIENRLKIINGLRDQKGKTLTVYEDKILKLAQNECIQELLNLSKKSNYTTEVTTDLLVAMYENAFSLQILKNEKDVKYMDGVSDTLYTLIPSMREYFAKHNNQLSDVANQALCKIAKTSSSVIGKLNVNQGSSYIYSFQNGYSIDLLALNIVTPRGPLTNVVKNFNNCQDYTRLFGRQTKAEAVVGQSEEKEFRQEGDSCFFTPSNEYGEIELVGTSDSVLGIYRTFNNAKLRYISQEKTSDLELPKCFDGDDFAIWVDTNGKVLIFNKDNPSKPVYKTNEQGKLEDLQNKNLYVELNVKRSEERNVINRFENEELCIFLCNSEGECQEIQFPRYKNEINQQIAFVKEGGNWLLKSDKEYKLVDWPTFSSKKSNPLFSYENNLWLENTTRSGYFMALVPHSDISKESGFTQQITVHSKSSPQGNEQFRQSEIVTTAYIHQGLNLSPSEIHSNTPLGYIRLARILQAQGKYQMAFNALTHVHLPNEVSDEIKQELAEMRNWYVEKGKEYSSRAAATSILALYLWMGIDYKETTSWLKAINKDDDAKKKIQEMFLTYYSGLSQLPESVRLSPSQEKYIQVIAPSCMPSGRIQDLDILAADQNKVKSLELLKESKKKLKELINQQTFINNIAAICKDLCNNNNQLKSELELRELGSKSLMAAKNALVKLGIKDCNLVKLLSSGNEVLNSDKIPNSAEIQEEANKAIDILMQLKQDAINRCNQDGQSLDQRIKALEKIISTHSVLYEIENDPYTYNQFYSIQVSDIQIKCNETFAFQTESEFRQELKYEIRDLFQENKVADDVPYVKLETNIETFLSKKEQKEIKTDMQTFPVK